MSDTTAVVQAVSRDLSPQLTQVEGRRLQDLEKRISTELVGAFYEVGKALAEIRDKKLYREKARTFEIYCRQCFEMAKTRAYELIQAALVYDDLAGADDEKTSAIGGQKILPANERQIRPLLRIENKEDRGRVWQLSIGAAREQRKEKPSGGMVNGMVKMFLGEVSEARIARVKDQVPVSRQLNPDLKQAFDLLTDEIRKAKSEGYKSAPRLAIIKVLDSLRRLLADDGDLVGDVRLSRSNREKLLRAGYVFFRAGHQPLIIEKEDSSHFDWQVVSVHETAEEMDQALADTLKASDLNLLD